jgi:hypothetical protein
MISIKRGLLHGGEHARCHLPMFTHLAGSARFGSGPASAPVEAPMTLIPTQVTFQGLAHSDEIESNVREHVRELQQFYAGIVRCRVALQVPHRHRRDGRHFHVRVEVTVPGGEPIVVSHEPSLHGRLKDVENEALHKDSEIDNVRRHARVAIHEAFDAARRRLEDFAREQRGAVKTHEPRLAAR